MIKNYVAVMKKYADFTGRARRREYWLFVLMNMIIAAIISSPISMGSEAATIFSIISGLYSLAIIIPTLAVLVRRMHDLGKSGGFIFVVFIPLVGAIWMLVLLFTDSSPGENAYGPNPKEVVVEAV